MAALDGMRVLDMTQYEAGTSCTQQLAWMGADVVKVEPPTGDPGRGVTRDPTQVSQYFLNYNSNKRSVVIDLSKPEGRQLLLDMVPRYDVFVENYGPGVIERLGLMHNALKDKNPGLIYARIKGFGTWGPYAGYNCYDWVAQAAGGTFSITGEPDGPPVMVQPSFADSGTGLQVALAIAGAYVKKLRTGEGEYIEASMQEAVTFFMKTTGLAAWGEAPQPRIGNRRGPPSGIYQCAGDGPNDYVFVLTVTSTQWDTFCAAIGHPELLADPRFESLEARMANADALYEIAGAWMHRRTKFEVMHLLGSAGVPCSAVFDTLDLFTDRHLKERELIHTVEHPTAGPVRLMRNPVLSESSQVPLAAAPGLGEHSEEVLSADLGLGGDRFASLKERGIVG